MEPMQFHARVGADGILRLEIPFEPGDSGSDVLVTVESAPAAAPVTGGPAWGGFLAETFGSGDAPGRKGTG